jgi:excisionase family DNA binding protein
MERLLTLDQAGEVLGVGPRFPRRLAAERKIRFVKVGRQVRIPEAAIAKYVQSRTVEPITINDV